MKILVCYDGTPPSEKILEAGIKMGKGLDAEIHLFTSIPPQKKPKEVFEFIDDEAGLKLKNARKEIEAACHIVKEAGIKCQTHVSNRNKNPGEDIVDFAEQIKAEYIVIGVRMHSLLEKIIFGSALQYVLIHSSCPVLAVR